MYRDNELNRTNPCRICNTNLSKCLRWFMGRLPSFFPMHWDHEPADRAVASWTAQVLWRFRLARPIAKAPEDWRTPKPGGARRFIESNRRLAGYQFEADTPGFPVV